MRKDFCAFILTHGRPDKVYTYKEIRAAGYTGDIILVVDDGDATLEEYKRTYPGEVYVFNKDEVAKTFDLADNFDEPRGVIAFARNVCFRIAKERGYKYFIQLDDDYFAFFYRFDEKYQPGNWRIRRTMDKLFTALVDYLEATPALLTVAIAQGGDFLGGPAEMVGPHTKRKCMNSFVCSVDRPFKFLGRVNEDVNTYVSGGRRGQLLLTIMQAQLCQKMTQQNSGGMSTFYRSAGTYLKTFYSVMFEPSSVKVCELSDPRSPHVRVHHRVEGRATYPRILRESLKKGSEPKKGRAKKSAA